MILTRPPAIGPEILFKILFRMGLTPPGGGRIALPVMKKLSLLLVAVLATLVPVSASFSEKVPKKHVNLIMIDAGESRGIDKIPQCVQAAMKKAPQIILTDAACEKVIATIEGRPDRKKADEFEKKAAAVTGKK